MRHLTILSAALFAANALAYVTGSQRENILVARGDCEEKVNDVAGRSCCPNGQTCINYAKCAQDTANNDSDGWICCTTDDLREACGGAKQSTSSVQSSTAQPSSTTVSSTTSVTSTTSESSTTVASSTTTVASSTTTPAVTLSPVVSANSTSTSHKCFKTHSTSTVTAKSTTTASPAPKDDDDDDDDERPMTYEHAYDKPHESQELRPVAYDFKSQDDDKLDPQSLKVRIFAFIADLLKMLGAREQ